jgi:hypothetical protein
VGEEDGPGSGSRLCCFAEVRFREHERRTAAVEGDCPLWNEQVGGGAYWAVACCAVLLCCCAAVLLCCCAAVLLVCSCAAVLLCCCAAVLLCCCAAVLLCCCAAVL